jgi:peroxiredoxin
VPSIMAATVTTIFGLLMALGEFALPAQTVAQAQSDPQLQQELQSGRNALAARDWIPAISYFAQASREANGSCEECFLGLAAAYSGNGQLHDAVDASDKALQVATDDGSKATAHTIKGKALVELSAKNRELLAQAETEFRAAAQIEKDNPIFHLWLGTVLLRESSVSEPTVSEPAQAKSSLAESPLAESSLAKSSLSESSQAKSSLGESSLAKSKTDEGVAELKKCLALNPSAAIADRAKLMLADPRRAGEEFAPNFRITTVQGEDLSLKQFAGKIVVLDFWATWCPPCRESVPELRDLTQKYDPAKLVLISVSADDDADAWRNFISDNKMTWPQYRDADKRLINAFTVRAYPTYLVIDADGVITQRIVGVDPKQSVVKQLIAILKTMPGLEGGK